MTAREAAIDLIKIYVLRGDSIKSLKDGQMGASSSKYSASIGGWDWSEEPSRRYSTDWIIIYRLGKQETFEKFKLKEIYSEIKTGHIQGQLL